MRTEHIETHLYRSAITPIEPGSEAGSFSRNNGLSVRSSRNLPNWTGHYCPIGQIKNSPFAGCGRGDFYYTYLI